MIAKPTFDCVVMGAGPGGATAANVVAEQGFSTLLVERDALPRFHVGESLMPETYWIFERLGILDELQRVGFTRKNGVQFVNADDKESRPFIFSDHDDRPCSETWHVQRSKFDQLLVDKAAERGATVQDRTRVLEIDIRDSGNHRLVLQTADGQQQEIWTRVLADASGQSSLIANRLGLKTYYPDLRKAAIWGYFENATRNPADQPEVTCILQTHSKDAWFWYIPLGDGTVSVGLVGDNDFLLKREGTSEETMQTEIANCPGIQRRLASAQRIGKLHVAKEFSYDTSRKAGQGWVLIGDAGGFIDPIYSSGVFLAMKSGLMAGEAIGDGLRSGDLSPEILGRWTGEYNEGVKWIRKLVRTFYTREFSFGDFMKSHPQHAQNLTNLLIGRVFDGSPGRMFDDLDPWLQRLRSEAESSMETVEGS